MTAPINTYRIRFPLPLGNVPRVNERSDPILYKELLDIHDSIIAVASGLESDGVATEDFINKFRSVITIDNTDSPYAINTEDGIIRVDASAGNVDLILPTVALTLGYEYKIKRIDLAPTTNEVNLDGSGGQLVDGHTGGVCISPLSSYTVKANASGYDII